MRVKTSELTGAQLDYAVSRALGDNSARLDDKGCYQIINRPGYITPACVDFKPSTDWSQGGPIIEREQIVYRHHKHCIEACVMAGEIGKNRRRTWAMKGGTILTAAMRAFVASKLGDEVEVLEV